MKSDTVKAIFLLNTAGLLWGGNMILGHYLKDYLGPWSIISTRLVIGGSIFILLLMHSGELKKIRHITNWWVMIALAITGVIGFQSFLYFGLRLTTSTNAGLINSLAPLLMALVAGIYFKEKLSYQHWIAALVTVFGLAFILSEGRLSNLLLLEFNWGDIYILAAVFSWVVYSIIGKQAMRTLSPLLMTALGVLLSLVIVLPLGVIEATYYQPPIITTTTFLAMLFISTGPTVLSLLFWNKGMHLIGPARASLFLNTVPVYIIIINAVFLDIMPYQYQWVGMALIFAGSFYASLRPAVLLPIKERK
ncbi:MAG: DMT family transporter [Cycloclasticus sp.]|nr:DMT family transporter [Cycloclasticus sp.]